MNKLTSLLPSILRRYALFGSPLALFGAALVRWAGSSTGWRDYAEAMLAMVLLSTPLVLISLLMDRERREPIMARLCGLREGDERERAVTGEAARATLLLGLSLQALVLLMSMVSVRLAWQPRAPRDEKKGVLSLGAGFSTDRHLNPSGISVESEPWLNLKRPASPPPPETPDELSIGGFLAPPGAFILMLALILLQIAAFKAFSSRRYAGADA